MKLNRLETHDRLEHFVEEQSINISQGACDCLKKNSLSIALQEKSPYIYIFAHPRTSDDGVTKKMFWQPRLTKPNPQTNSYLFRAKSKTDIMEVCWLLPPSTMWKQYKKGNVTEHEWVRWSVDQFTNNRVKMGKPEPDDFSDERCKQIYKMIAKEMNQDKTGTNILK